MSQIFNKILGLTGGNKQKITSAINGYSNGDNCLELLIYAINGYSNGDNCSGGNDVIVNYSGVLVITDFALGVSITHNNGGTFTISNPGSSLLVGKINYAGSWDIPLGIGDLISYNYNSSIGDYTDFYGAKILDQSISINNCESKTVDGYYITGSIYNGTKDIDTVWIAEPLASAVNTVWIKNITPASVEIGYGATIEAASSTVYTINSGDSILLPVAGSYVAWKGSVSGTMSMEQSVAR